MQSAALNIRALLLAHIDALQDARSGHASAGLFVDAVEDRNRVIIMRVIIMCYNTGESVSQPLRGWSQSAGVRALLETVCLQLKPAR